MAIIRNGFAASVSDDRISATRKYFARVATHVMSPESEREVAGSSLQNDTLDTSR